jgi:hypothetical protein
MILVVSVFPVLLVRIILVHFVTWDQVSVTKGMRMGDLQSTSVTLQLADRSIRKPAGILLDIPVMVGKFAYPVDFIVLDMDNRSEAVILGRPFLATAGALIDVK